MEEQKLQVTYLSHSGFFVKSCSCCILFDYIKGTLPPTDGLPLYIFASHRHADHFSREIFSLAQPDAPVRYVLSSDIKKVWKPEQAQKDAVTFLPPDTTASIGPMQIRTLHSTDTGTAFLVHVDEKTIYHAGDLHLWLWEEEDTPEQAEKMTKAFLAEVRKLKGQDIDAAFLPLDPRQTEAEYWRGMDTYARSVQIRHIFPMHLWGEYALIDRMKAHPCAREYADRIVRITKEEEQYEV